MYSKEKIFYSTRMHVHTPQQAKNLASLSTNEYKEDARSLGLSYQAWHDVEPKFNNSEFWKQTHTLQHAHRND